MCPYKVLRKIGTLSTMTLYASNLRFFVDFIGFFCLLSEMAIGTGRFFNFLKKYCSKSGSVVVPLNLRLVTNYNAVVMFDSNLADINCSPPNTINLRCLNGGITIAWTKQALDPKLRGTVLFPGISPHERGIDAIIPINYYNKIWLLFGAYIILSYVPYIFLKAT